MSEISEDSVVSEDRVEEILARSNLADFQKELIRELVKGDRKIILLQNRHSGRAAIRRVLKEIFPES